jgi:hypothetical protein
MLYAVALIAGCSSDNSYDLVCYNKSGGPIDNVKISHGEKSFRYGYVGNVSGYMIASNRFGALPESMELSFENKDGERFVRTVDFSNVRGTGEIAIVVGPELQVTASNGKPN